MSLRVVALDERGREWDEALGQFSARERDVYFTSAYHLLWQRNGDGRAMGAVFEGAGGRVLYPFLRRRLADVPWLGGEFSGLDDISSAYGYGGPLVGAAAEQRPRLLAEFRSAFLSWCAAERIVSEFVRFHPLLHTEEDMAAHLKLTPANETVVCRVAERPEDHLAAMNAATRRNVAKAQRAGLRCALETSEAAYDGFLDLYLRTMRRRQADSFYLFGPSYLADFRELLGQRQSLLAVWHQERMVAAALFLRSSCFAHYHLGGSDAEALGLRPNNLLFFEAMNWAGGQGITEVHLGGGYGGGGDDELLRFKSGFSPQRSRLYIGRAVHLKGAYEQATQRRTACGPGTASGFFPAYRSRLPGG